MGGRLRGQPITAVVTGVTGQDGFYLVRHLLQEGSSVHAISRRELPPQETPRADGARFVAHHLDLLDQENVESLIREVRPDEIYNLAGASSVATSIVDPVASWQSIKRRCHPPGVGQTPLSGKQGLSGVIGRDVRCDWVGTGHYP